VLTVKRGCRNEKKRTWALRGNRIATVPCETNRTGSVRTNQTGSHMYIKRRRGRFLFISPTLSLSSSLLEREALASLYFLLLLRPESGEGSDGGWPTIAAAPPRWNPKPLDLETKRRRKKKLPLIPC